MNQRKIHNLIQGTPEWDEFRATHYGASLAAAMLGLDPKTTRTELLDLYATGISKEFPDYVKDVVFARGHATEALARPIVERIIGDELSPTVYSLGKLSASCDGITFSEDAGFEHKQFNAELFAMAQRKEVPDSHMPQVQQSLLVTKAKKWHFTVSDGTEDKMAIVEVLPDQEWFDRIINGWKKFDIDMKTHTPRARESKPIADAVPELPTLFVHAKGEITADNLTEWGVALTAHLADTRAIILTTDQDFANADKRAKVYRETCKKLMLAKDAMLAQTMTIGDAAKLMDAWHEDLRVTALQIEKRVKDEKDIKKLAIVMEAQTAYAEHIAALEFETSPYSLPIDRPNFADAMKGKSLFSAMQNAVDTLMANTKIRADELAADYRSKLKWYSENATHPELFRDMKDIILKHEDDFQLLVTSRIEAHKKSEAAKIEAERAQMQAEATAKAEREAQVIIAAETARVRAEEQKIAAENARIEKEKVDAEKIKETENTRAVLATQKPAGAETVSTVQATPADEDIKTISSTMPVGAGAPQNQSTAVIDNQKVIANFLRTHPRQDTGAYRAFAVELLKYRDEYMESLL
jgi:predicted phage-related endonuclease